MSSIVYDIKDIMQKLWGYNAYNLPTMSAEITQDEYKIETTRKGTPIYGKDLLGRDVFLPVTIVADGVDYEYPYAVLSMKRKKMMVSTPMVERGGSVKELIGLEDWSITMKGFLIDPLNRFPDDQLTQLHQLFLKNKSVRLKCALSDLFLESNDNVVITDLDIPDKAKVVGVRDFVMSMESDSILTLIAD